MNARRHFVIEPQPNGTTIVRCELLPHPLGGVWKFELFGLPEEIAHEAARFAMAHPDIDMESLYELTEAHIGRAPYGAVWKP